MRQPKRAERTAITILGRLIIENNGSAGHRAGIGAENRTAEAPEYRSGTLYCPPALTLPFINLLQSGTVLRWHRDINLALSGFTKLTPFLMPFIA